MQSRLQEIDVVILCGGLGKRLKSVVGDRPKVLARIGGKVFLDVLINNLLLYGFRRIILSVGHLKEQIIDHFRQKAEYECEIEFSEEHAPLGTGGALKKTEPLIKSDTFLVMNGDSFCDVDFDKLLDFHIGKSAIMTMVLARSDAIKDYGSITLDDSCRIQGFKEKVSSVSNKMVNAGIYLMQKDIFSYMSEGDVFSLEYDFFPRLTESECYGYLTGGELFDIGTPERYEKAKKIFGTRIGPKQEDE